MRNLGLAGAILLAVSSVHAAPHDRGGSAAAAGGAGFVLMRNGDLVHLPTGTRFPRKAFGFTRIGTGSFDVDGKNVAVTYQRGSGATLARARLALVQIDDMSALEHFAGLAPAIATYFDGLDFSDVRPISNGPLDLPGVAPRNAWQGRFTAWRDGLPYLLSLSTLDMGRWAGRVTAAYPDASAADSQRRLFALVAKIRRTGPEHIHPTP